MNKIILWSVKERAAFFKNFKLCYQNNPTGHIPHLIEEAQKVLSVFRRRNPHSVYNSVWFTTEFKKHMLDIGVIGKPVSVVIPPKAIEKKVHIRWSKEERSIFLKEFYKYFSEQPKAAVVFLVRLAMKSITKDRLRDAHSVRTSEWFLKELPKLEKRRMREVKAALASPTTLTNIASAAHVALTNATVPEPAASPAYSLDEIVKSVVLGLTPHLERIIEEKLSSVQIQSAIDNATVAYLMNLGKAHKVEATPTAQTPVVPDARVVAKKDLKRVVLINLLPAQFNDVSREYGELFDLVLWSAGDSSLQALKAHANNAYRIYGMVDHMKHNVDKVVSGIAGKRYIRYTGSTSTLKSLLEKEYCEL